MLSDKEKRRYSRHLLFDGVGEKGQLSLKNARIAVVGAGGLGSPVLLYLAAAGVGFIRVIDFDEVELSNLQRQVIYKVNHLGQPKVKAAAKVMASLNNEIEIDPINEAFNEANGASLLEGMSLVLDCSDNFVTRYLVNRLCVEKHIPLVAGAAIGGQGQVMGFDFCEPDSPCYHCVFPEQDASETLNCSNSGVFGPLLGMVGSMQAQLAVNYLLGHQKGALFRVVDALTLSQRAFTVTPDSACPVCRSLHPCRTGGLSEPTS